MARIRKDTDCLKHMPVWEKILVIVVISISITSLYAVAYSSITSYQHKSQEVINTTTDAPTYFHVISRTEWGARGPEEPPEILQILPAPYVIMSDTNTRFCKHSCKRGLRKLQEDNIKIQKLGDIAFNFLIGGDGFVYEGRGWNVSGNHTHNYDNRSIGVAFIGSYDDDRPTKKQFDATKDLLDYGVKFGNIDKNYLLFGRRQLTNFSSSPGDNIYEIIKAWEHWSSHP